MLVAYLDESDGAARRPIDVTERGPMPAGGTVTQALRSAFDRYGDRVAIEEWPSGRTLTYTELDAASSALAAEISQRGVAPDSFVPLVMPRCADFLIAVVAILRCGAAYAPIDPAAPRRDSLLEPLNAPVVIGTEPGMLDPTNATQPNARTWVDASPEDPAYVMYTSGTTGQPKGVVVPHRAVVRLVVDANYAEFGPERRWGMMSAVAFDASTLEVWGALLHGGCCVVQAMETPGLGDLADYLLQGRVSDTWLTASLFNAMVDEQPHAMAGMRQLLTGGERESVPHVRRFKQHNPGVRLVHGYGPTENTTFSLCHAITNEDAAGDRIPIGKPISGSTMRIVKPGDSPDQTADDKTGELLVGGAGLALGYLHDDEQTAKKFVLDRNGNRWYRTGDLVRLRADGAAVFEGRVDRQVKIRGHRVEPDGIEHELAACPGVEQGAIAVTGDSAETRGMTAFFVPKPDATATDVRSQLAGRVSRALLPERFVPVASMPRGTTGKIDRSALATDFATITDRFRHVVNTHGNRIAIEEWPSGRQLTYQELDASSAALARELRERGIKVGDSVPIVMARCADYVISIVAVLRCGAAYAPIDPDAPRRQAMLDPLGSPVVVGHEPGMVGPQTVARAGDEPDIQVQPESAAYIMYTSGTTGTPKGVVVPHSGVVRLVHLADYATFDHTQRWGVMSATAFDLSTLEIWGALLHGGCCVVQAMNIPNTDDLATYLVDGRVTDTWLTASLFNAMVDEHPESMAHMRQLLTGGERESARHIREFKRHCPRVALIHGYGPTENTTFSLCHTITDKDAQQDRIPIGRTINGSTMRIIAPGEGPDAPASPLREGELLVGGQGLAIGYLNDETKTSEKFPVDSSGERWYRTGDLVRLRDDGAAVFEGRVDRQVKIRGHRVEPDGVEALLASCQGVEQAAVAVTGDTAETRRMIAFFIAEGDATATTVREALAMRLAPTQMPDRFVAVQAMPMGSSGKVDRNALVAQLEREEPQDSDSASGLATTLVNMFSHRLGGPIRPDQAFREAGGHSLVAMRISADVRRDLGVELTAAQILRHQTIDNIARVFPDLPRSVTAPRSQTTAQVGDIRRRASLEHERDGTGLAMLVHHALHVDQAVDVDRLREAWLTLLERHNALRERVVFTDTGPSLAQHNPRLARVFHAEHDRLDAPNPGDPRVHQAISRTIGPDDPPARMHVWPMTDGSQLILMVFHHAAIDEWSLDIVTSELHALLRGNALEPAPPYSAFVAAEQAMMDDGLVADLATRISHGAPPAAELPPTGPQAGRVFEIERDLLTEASLDARAEAIGVSPPALIAAAFGLTLRSQYGAPGRWLMTPFARRPGEDLQRVVGCCLDMRPMEGSGETFVDVAQSLHRQMLDGQEERALPLESLIDRVRSSALERAGDATRFGLTYRYIDDRPHPFGSSLARPINIPQPAARFGLCLHVERRPSGLRLWIEASGSHFAAQGLGHLADQVVGILLKGDLQSTSPPVALSEAQTSTGGASTRDRMVLAELWSELLGVAPRPASDFFQDGGTSLLAMRLTAAVHKRLGRRLMLNQFLRTPTLDGLAQSIRDDVEHPYAEFSRAATDETPGEAPWCVAIPGSAGRAIDAYKLWYELHDSGTPMDMLAFDVSTIAMDELSEFDADKFFTRFAALTHSYALANRREGPITLVGYSLGGLVVMDMARRLTDLGHNVQRIVLLDAYAPAYLSRTIPWLLAKLNARVRTLGQRSNPGVQQPRTQTSEEARAAEARRETWQTIHRTLRHWTPPAVRVPTVLLRSTPTWTIARPVWHAHTNGLRPWLRGPVDVRTIDVAHLAMLTTSADEVAANLCDVLCVPAPATPPTHANQLSPNEHLPARP